MSQIAFYTLSVLSVFSALMVVFSKRAVHSILYLIFCFFTIAGHYILLNAQFLAAVHVIVYAGAIMVLFLFVIMLLNLNNEKESHKSNILKFAAVVSAGLMLIILVAAFGSADELKLISAPEGQIGMVQMLGQTLYSKYLLPFEVSALLFLAAMVGATMIGKKETH
ncbi:MAG TPA: NADH-quinone oxidoreductase subunit J [Bacteroidia bacterium]|nr:NADH-quinone oxidoreductase subunit J [Bacteroidia bacterium]